MASRGEIFRCAKGLAVEVLTGIEDCSLECCGDPMPQLVENTTDAAVEKHVPVIERSECRCEIKVKVGSVAHPMTAEHLIEWVEVIDGDRVTRQYLKPGEAPEAEFCVCSEKVVVREHCNLHGLWKAEG